MNSLYPELGCKICRHNGKPIPSDGPRPCRVMFIGEAPAREELRRNQNFVGPSGTEYNRNYLPLAGLTREGVFTCNATRCPFPGFRNPTPEEAAVCSARHLPRELREVSPEVIVPMGAVACSLFPNLTLDLDHGLPSFGSYGDWSGWLFPNYHPAAGIRNPDFYMRMLRADFIALGTFLKELSVGIVRIPKDAFPAPRYWRMQSKTELSTYLLDRREIEWLGVDTENDQETGLPWCLTASHAPGSGYMIRANQPELLAEFGAFIRARRPLVIFHHGLHDLPVCAAMGVLIERFDDTMVRAYLLGLQQGLKTLAWRLCGMKMKEYEDVVFPRSMPYAQSYLSDAAMVLEGRFYTHTKKGKLKSIVGTPKSSLMTYRKAQKAVLELDADPWKRWDGWHDGDREMIQEIMGRSIPKASIKYVPDNEAETYAIRDADATLRIYPILRSLAAAQRRSMR